MRDVISLEFFVWYFNEFATRSVLYWQTDTCNISRLQLEYCLKTTGYLKTIKIETRTAFQAVVRNHFMKYLTPLENINLGSHWNKEISVSLENAEACSRYLFKRHFIDSMSRWIEAFIDKTADLQTKINIPHDSIWYWVTLKYDSLKSKWCLASYLLMFFCFFFFIFYILLEKLYDGVGIPISVADPGIY